MDVTYILKILHLTFFYASSFFNFFYYSNLFIQIQSLNAKRWFSGINAIKDLCHHFNFSDKVKYG